MIVPLLDVSPLLLVVALILLLIPSPKDYARDQERRPPGRHRRP